jgi:hypothetical protein
MNTQDISKTVFLVFVIVVAGYIMYTNNIMSLEHYEDVPPTTTPPTTAPTTPTTPTTSSTTTPTTTTTSPPTTSTTPTTTPTVQKSTSQTVNEIYKELFGADPKPEETTFYVNFFKNRETSRDYMKEIISTSAPTLQKTLKAGVQQLVPDMPLGTEDEVIAIYNQILERSPSPEELQYYSNFIKQGPANVEKMKVLLIQSSEYKRLQQLQDNKAYGFLLGGITDKQLTLMVNGVYTQVGGNPNNLDEDTLKFLKKKYLEYQLNEQVFKKFLQDFVMYDSKAKTASQSGTSQSSPSTTSSLHANSSVTGQLINSSFSSQGKKESYTNECKVDTQAMINKIKKEADCQFNKNKLDDKYRSNRESSLAQCVHDRNREELKNICERNKSFSQFHDDDMVLIPSQEWTVPQKHTPPCYGNKSAYNPLVEQTALIGTLLKDSKDTQIGSIMPKFTFKEQYDS